MEPLLQRESNTYYIFWVCICSISYPATNAHAPYCHLWPARFCNIFTNYLINGTIFEKKLPNTKYFLMFSTTFVRNSYHSKKNSAGYYKNVWGGADKSLTRPGRKQATATNLGIYSTYSSRNSIHFLTRCSNLCKPLKKKFRRLSVQPGLRGSNDLRVGRKMATFQLLFQSREQVVVRRGQMRRIGWVIKTMDAQAGQFLLGCKCPVRRGIVLQEQDLLGDLPAAFFPQNILQLYQQRWVMIRVDSSALWKTINEEDTVLIAKKKARNFPTEFCTRNFFRGWDETICRYSIDCCFVSG